MLLCNVIDDPSNVLLFFVIVVGKESSNSELIGSSRKQESASQFWNTKQGVPGKYADNREGHGHGILNKDRNSIYQGETVEPCCLSSSLYYGGQEVYTQSSSSRVSESKPIFKKDGEDDPNGNNLNSASRGNWWQGSLYY
uniref:Uncharacterized protein n=1 Tax=Nelumbo nucifera TaxID=4432 RepID=A0A822Y1S7_NELNU|nr:TPA_asm: hypothetical protein HUJ06_028038 [Nelumbo nucifera]